MSPRDLIDPAWRPEIDRGQQSEDDRPDAHVTTTLPVRASVRLGLRDRLQVLWNGCVALEQRLDCQVHKVNGKPRVMLVGGHAVWTTAWRGAPLTRKQAAWIVYVLAALVFVGWPILLAFGGAR